VKIAQRAWAGLAVLAAVVVTATGCGKVEVPKSFTEFNAKDGTVALQRPKGWEQKRGTAKKFRSVAFHSGPAKIRVLADVSGSLMAGPNPNIVDEDMPEELTPVAGIHQEVSIPQFKDEVGEGLDVKDTKTIDTGFGDTRISEFTYSGTLGGATHGYLVTALGHDKRVRVICTCPDKVWNELQPAYDEVVKSMGPGRRE
jgi:hypothetical protein